MLPLSADCAALGRLLNFPPDEPTTTHPVARPSPDRPADEHGADNPFNYSSGKEVLSSDTLPKFAAPPCRSFDRQHDRRPTCGVRVEQEDEEQEQPG